MFRVLSDRKCFIVVCRACRRPVSIGQPQFPFHSISVRCRLCRAEHRYRPSEISRGRAETYVALDGAVLPGKVNESHAS